MSDTARTTQESSTGRWNALERWRAAAFLLAGVLLLGFAARNAVIAFGSGFSERTTGLLYLAFVVPAEAAAYVGLFGLYPQLSERTPGLAKAGAGVAGVAAVALVGFAASALAALAGTPQQTPLSDLFYLVMLVTTVLGFLLFATASLRTDTPSRSVGLLLFGPPIIYVVMFVSGLLLGGEPPAWSTFAISAVQAGAHIAVGLALRNGTTPADRSEPAPDSVA